MYFAPEMCNQLAKEILRSEHGTRVGTESELEPTVRTSDNEKSECHLRVSAATNSIGQCSEGRYEVVWSQINLHRCRTVLSAPRRGFIAIFEGF